MWEREREQVRAYPEVVVSCFPYVGAVAEHVAGEAGAEVAGEVNGVPGFPTPGAADAEDDEEETQGGEVSCAEVAV